MQWARYNLFLILCLVLVMKAQLFPTSSYPYGFNNSVLFEIIRPVLEQKLMNWDQANIKVLIAYLLGLPLKGFSTLNSAHEVLYLSHLLSPSAFHLICFSWILHNTMPRYLVTCFWLLLYLVGWYWNFYHPALQRSILLAFVSSFHFVCASNRESQVRILILALIFDYFWGSYQLMPLSYVFTFIILGHILFLPTNWSLFKKLFVAQIILSVIFSLPFNLLGFTLGYYLGLIFLPLFTFILIYLFLSPITHLDFSTLLQQLFTTYLIIIQEIANFLKSH